MRLLPRAVLRFAATAALGLLLAACTISSDKQLLADGEGVTPLPASFVFFPYSMTAPGVYARSPDAPSTFTLNGKSYHGADPSDPTKTADIRFIPAGKDFLFAASTPGAPVVVYGFAHYQDGILAVSLSPDKTTTDAIAAAKATASPDDATILASLKLDADSGAVTVPNRPALDLLSKLYGDGKLPLGAAAVAYIGADLKAATPTSITQGPDGRWASAK